MKKILGISLFLFTLVKIQAAEITNLYEAEVPVRSKNLSTAEQINAEQQGLQDILLKVVGNRNLLNRTYLNPILREASNLVQQFRYNISDENVPIFHVNFDPQGVKKLLVQNNLPVWGENRPTLLLWIAIEDSRKRYLLTSNQSSLFIDRLKKQADMRGIPIIFPLWDLEDQKQLTFGDVWGNFTTPIQAASHRYPATVQIVGRILRQGGNTWKGRWNLYSTEETQNWNVSGGMTQVLDSGLNKSVDIIANHLVSGSSTLQSVIIQVSNVNSFTDYAKLSNYFKTLSQVSKVQPIQLSQKNAKFFLEIHSSISDLASAISYGRVLTEDTQKKYDTDNIDGNPNNSIESKKNELLNYQFIH
ncbi:DUF2066 domain-containing protein [Candidatus Nitrosacidococcus tergens]|uniref:DUF2066 domain-containing protein n=1 Tax=Candidatus Nitrosacidococcus tergens TaxID=553981 RepID=A0A7G1QAE9_9GAMM|nr:DUF2066 domain-containing protein [Candidatus Nitrosacidococcus tergens]CAB1276485.1 conserved exported protein of unknown function [Candidatus Nitrosacidococcus tergens]